MRNHEDNHDLPKFSENGLYGAHDTDVKCCACGDNAGDDPIVYVLTFCGEHGRLIEEHGVSVSTGSPIGNNFDTDQFPPN